MCVQNCGPSFQSLVVKKDFCKERLVKLLNPRYALPADTQDKILTFIMTWARGFQGTVDVSEVKEVYLELLKKGVQFPCPDTNTETKKVGVDITSNCGCCTYLYAILSHCTEQIGKLNSELDMTKMNIKVMSSILKENVPGSENPEDMNLLQKLYKTCRAMQERIMELLAVVQNEDVIIELIHVNENLNNYIIVTLVYKWGEWLHQKQQFRANNASPVPSSPSQDNPVLQKTLSYMCLFYNSYLSCSHVSYLCLPDAVMDKTSGCAATKNSLDYFPFFPFQHFANIAVGLPLFVPTIASKTSRFFCKIFSYS
uniref:Target of myb1 like 1 membrane trafficking protein n=1 Tax=Crocodylus porosus TaxID=8502 RepID=A0A7M4E1X6_CROPO